MSSRAKKKREWRIKKAIHKHLTEELAKCKDIKYTCAVPLSIKEKL